MKDAEAVWIAGTSESIRSLREAIQPQFEGLQADALSRMDSRASVLWVANNSRFVLARDSRGLLISQIGGSTTELRALYSEVLLPVLEVTGGISSGIGIFPR
jgi:hypothetical protein